VQRKKGSPASTRRSGSVDSLSGVCTYDTFT
jgi:hypothetical protein